MCAAVCFIPPHGNSAQTYFDVMKVTRHERVFTVNCILHKCIKSTFFSNKLSQSHIQDFVKVNKQGDSVFALVRLIAGVTESPRDPSRGP